MHINAVDMSDPPPATSRKASGLRWLTSSLKHTSSYQSVNSMICHVCRRDCCIFDAIL